MAFCRHFSLSLLLILASCSPVRRTMSPQKAIANANIEEHQNTPVPTDSGTFLTLPNWCHMDQKSDQLCFTCERADSGNALRYQQCLTPSDSFNINDCTYTDNGVKSISCSNTVSGSFNMDVSTAREKALFMVSSLLVFVELTAKDKFPDNIKVRQFTQKLASFGNSRLSGILNGQDLEATATDLLNLILNASGQTLSESQTELFKTTAVSGFTVLANDLKGQKDYRLSQVILRLLGIAKTLPDGVLGSAKPYLSGPGLCEFLDAENPSSFIFKNLSVSPAIQGAKSLQDFIAELKNAS